MFSYRLFLKQAWTITKRYPHIWFFGIFASLLSLGGEYQIIAKGTTSTPGGQFISDGNLILQNFFNPSFYSGLADLAIENRAALISLITIFLLALVLAVVMFYLAILSQTAIIKQSAHIIISKKKKERLSINEGLIEARKHFWRVLALNLTSYVIVSLSLLLISLPLLFLLITDSIALNISYAILFMIFVPIALSIALTIKYAIAIRVLEGKSYISSLTKAIRIFKDNWLVSLEMALILFLINFVVGIVTIFFISLFFLPMLFIALQFFVPILVALSLLLSIGTMLIVASWLNTFQISAWTGLYLHLQDKKGHSKLERLFNRK
jgi:hypothetical protein